MYGTIHFNYVKVPALVALADDAGSAALRLGLGVGQPSATPKAGRLLGQAGLLTFRCRRASTAGLTGKSIGTAQPHAQKGVLFRPRVRHVGSLAKSHCFRTDTAGPGGPAVSLIKLEGSPPPGRRSRQAVLRVCSWAVEAVEATTACTTSK